MEDFYPMPMFATLQAQDVKSSAAWYAQALGFRIIYQTAGSMGRGPSLIHLRRDRYQDLLLVPVDSTARANPGQGVTLTFQAGTITVDALADQARSVPETHVEGPVDRPWNVRDLTVIDPDGYRLQFVEPIDTGRAFDDVMGNT